jgi:hypothetical protein
VPPLGRPYAETWAEEERSLLPGAEIIHPHRPGSADKKGKRTPTKGSTTDLAPPDTTDAFCGPLTERLVSALFDEERDQDTQISQSDYEDEGFADDDTSVNPAEQGQEEMYDIEERLKRELCYIGLLKEDEVSRSYGTV